MAAYKIINVGANKCLNIFGSNINGNNLSPNRDVTIWDDTNSPEQIWIINSLDHPADPPYILSYVNFEYGLNAYIISGNTTYNCDVTPVAGNSKDSEVGFEYVTGGYYRIYLKNYSPRKYLSVVSSSSGTSVKWAEVNTFTNFHSWRLVGVDLVAHGPDRGLYAKSVIGAGGISESEMIANGGYIAQRLQVLGNVSLVAICGMLGNFERESYMNPGAWGSTGYKLSSVYGIAQFNNASAFCEWAYSVEAISAKTVDTLKNLADGTPLDKHLLLDIQIAYLLWTCEVRGHFGTKNGWTYELYRTASASKYTPQQLAEAFWENYERSSGGDLTLRQQAAGEWYDRLK